MSVLLRAPYMPAPSPTDLPAVILVCKSLRVWSNARSKGEETQQALFSLLKKRGLGLLAPVFDGLFTCFTTAHKRELKTGCGCAISPDEATLWSLLRGVGVGRPGTFEAAADDRLLFASVASARSVLMSEIEIVDKREPSQIVSLMTPIGNKQFATA